MPKTVKGGISASLNPSERGENEVSLILKNQARFLCVKFNLLLFFFSPFL